MEKKTRKKPKFKVPADIEPEAKTYMREVLAHLEEVDLLSSVDNAALMMLARNYSMFIKANKELETTGLTVTTKKGEEAHPLVKVARDAQVQAVKIMTEFGLTAKARTKLEKAAPPKESDSDFEVFLKQVKEFR